VPAASPVTVPVALTEAVALAVLQVPPGVASARAIDAASHTTDGPVMGATVSGALTVTIREVVPVRQADDEL
jgi:hypothetical protein